MLQIKNDTKSTVVASNAREATGFFGRLAGLLGRSELSQGEALIIRRCNAIHMMGMRFAIDAIFTDKSNRIIRLIPNLKPWMCSPFVLRAGAVIELPVSAISKSKCELGDQLSFS